MLQTMKKGFTLIELLVVITIIGILATGAVTVYTSQIQKARDTTRTSDMKALQGGIEQAYQDGWQYPTKWASGAGTFGETVTTYIQRLTQDPKSGQASAKSPFDYLYNVSADSNTIPGQEYEVSTHYEQTGNITGKAATDGGDDENRLEVGVNVSDTEHTTKVSWSSITAAAMECVSNAGAPVACTGALPMVIKNN